MKDKLTIRQLRNLRGLSLEKASIEIGVTREHLGRMETDKEVLKGVRIETILRIAKSYNTKVDDINFFDVDIT